MHVKYLAYMTHIPTSVDILASSTYFEIKSEVGAAVQLLHIYPKLLDQHINVAS